jgi:DNA invertase Pin-like site-specific DNA recombinase
MKPAQPLRRTAAREVVPRDPRTPEEPAGWEGRSLTVTTLVGSDQSDAVARAMPPPSGDPVRRGVWAQSGGVFVFVAGLGLAEVHLLGMPGWLGVVFVALGCVMAADRVFLARRAKPAGLLTARASAHASALPAAEPREADPDRAEPLPEIESEHGVPVDDPVADAGPSAARPALGYTCVPVDANGELAYDTEKITAWCAEGGLAVAKVVHDVEGQPGERGGGPGLRWALDQIAAGEADTLVVARLQNLSPNVANLPSLLRWFTHPERRLVAIDLRLDTATEAGRLAAFALAGVGSWENERLSARTRRGLEAARSRGAGRAGAAVADVPELRERIVRMRKDGMTLQAIADVLNEEGVPTLRGGAKWRPSSVHGATGYRRPTSTRGIQIPAESPGPRQGPADKR